MHSPHQRDNNDDHGPGSDDRTRRGRPNVGKLSPDSDPDAVDPDHLADYGYSGQGYPIYGRPSGLDPQSDPEPRWFADPGAIGYASGFTPPLIRREPRAMREGGHSGKGPKDNMRADSRIHEDVCERLSDDDEVDASDITVNVHQGEVLLEGEVADRHDKRRAENIALEVRGVIDVRNELHVKKSFFQELGDKLVGDDTEHHGHHGSGTRNAPAE